MLFDYIRILKSISSVLTDISYENQDDTIDSTLPLAPSDFFLLGMQYPFNNFFLNIGTPNGPRDVVTSVTITTPYDAIGPVDEVQLITFLSTPSAGAWILTYGVDETTDLAFDASASAIETALRLITGLATVTVTGNYTIGFSVTFVGIPSPTILSVTTPTITSIAASIMSVEHWNGSQWTPCVDLMDGSSLSGASLSKGGHVLYSLDKTKSGWAKVSDPTVNGPTELSTKAIYDLYWLKVKFSGQIPADVTVKELGFAWTTGQKLKQIKSEVDRYLPAFATGKTNWIPEIMTACKMMVTDLKKANLVYGPQQVVRMDDFWLPATYKTLWIIYSSLGPAYKDQADAVHHQFYKTMNVDNITLDQNMDGRVQDWEKNSRVKEGVR